jgi:prevent-host-death family protein
MARVMSAEEARAKFEDLLGTLSDTKEPVIVEKRGKPVAVMISPEDYSLLRRQREAAFSVIDRIRERNADFDPDDVLRDTTEVVEEVRQERYEQRQRAPQSGH